MRRGAKLLLIGICLLAIACFASTCWRIIYNVRYPHRQKQAARTFVATLSRDKMIEWIQWAEAAMEKAQADPTKESIGSFNPEEFPPMLQELGLTHYFTNEDAVELVWLSGFDHVQLRFQRDPRSNITVKVWYSDFDSEDLWPEH